MNWKRKRDKQEYHHYREEFYDTLGTDVTKEQIGEWIIHYGLES